MKKMEEILNEWQEDSKMDRTQLHVECSNVPILHSKYMIHLNTAKTVLRKLRVEQTQLYRKLSDYYAGLCDAKDLASMNRTQWPRKTLRNEIPEYVKSDDEYLELQKRITYMVDMVEGLQEILKNINGRSFIIRDCLEWYKLTQFSE